MKKSYLLFFILLIGVCWTILFYAQKKNCSDDTPISKSFLDSVNEAIQEKPLLTFTDYGNDLDTLKSYSTLNYHRMVELASSDEQKLALKDEMKQWEECSKYLHNLCSNILETNFGGGTMSIPLSHIYASYVYSLRAEMSEKEIGLLDNIFDDDIDNKEKLDLEELLIAFQNSIHDFCNQEWEENKKLRIESCKKVVKYSRSLSKNIRIWKRQRDNVASLFTDEHKRNAYNNITNYYLCYVFKDLIPDVFGENGRNEVIEKYK